MTYPAAYRSTMTGATIKAILEDVAGNLFSADPYYQQGGDMVRVGGMGYAIDPTMTIGEVIDPARDYVVAGWASVNEGMEGPPIWDMCEQYLAAHPFVTPSQNRSVDVAS